MRAAFVTWLLAAALATGGLATVLVYLALVGYFEAPDLEAFSFDRAELATALWFLVAGHVVSRTHVSAPRCLALTRTFGAAFSYRVAPEVVVGCGSPGACAGRARLALHRRVALGVGLSIPIALVGFHALHGHPSLGGRGCLSSPLHYGGNVLFYSALALVAILSHAPLAAGCGVRTLTTEARTRRGFTSMGGGGLNGRPRPVLLAQL